MFNYTQLVLIASCIAEYNQKLGTKDAQSAFTLLTSIGKAMSHQDVLGVGVDSATPLVAKHPLAAIGQVVESLTKERVNTWEGEELDMISLAKVVNAIADIDPNDSSVNSESTGKKVIEALPPMIRSTVESVMDVADSFGSQLETDDHIVKQPIGSTVIGELPLDSDTKGINRQSMVDTSRRQLI